MELSLSDSRSLRDRLKSEHAHFTHSVELAAVPPNNSCLGRTIGSQCWNGWRYYPCNSISSP